MCSSNTKLQGGSSVDMTPTVSHINGRPVLQPKYCNRTTPLLLDRRNSLKKSSKKSLQPLSSPSKITTSTTTSSNIIKPSATTPPVSPPAVKRSGGNDPNNDKVVLTTTTTTTPKGTNKLDATSTLENKSKKSSGRGGGGVPSSSSLENSSLKYSSSLIMEAPGSIAAARREQVAIMQVQRKMRIAHYGRTKSAKCERKQIPDLDHTYSAATAATTIITREENRCNFITANSDPIYVAYHDEEWGVPVHDDKMLFESLVLTGAQVGSDWTSVLKRRQDFRDAFSGFDAESVSKYTEKKITSISADYGIQVSLVRGVVDNANRILEMKREFGSFDNYLWGFVNHKPIATQYKSCFKIPVKTSKSESISKDMVRRGFRLVGPTVIHSFMQAVGLTNDHIISCPRHLQWLAFASHQPPTVAPAHDL